MTRKPRGVVIVGAGQAGLQAAASLRERGFDAPVQLIGAESALPYQRPPLTKACLSEPLGIDDLHFEPESFFEKNDIALRTGETVDAIDRRARRVTLASGAELAYDHLVLATGARARAPNWASRSIDGVFTLRTFDDMAAIREALPRSERVVIVGGGFIGLEIAASIASENRSVHVVEALGRLMERAVSPVVSTALRRSHVASGVRFAFQRHVAALGWRQQRVTHVELDDGTRLDADMVIVSIGIEPNVEVGLRAGLAVRNGISVNARLLTEDAAISAIGDCSAFASLRGDGNPLRLECVQNAVDHGRFVAARLTGGAEIYDAVPTFWSDQPGVRLQIAGIGLRGDLAVTRGDASSARFSVFRYRDDRLACVESVGSPGDHMAARRLLARGTGPTPEQAGDIGFDLRAFAAQTSAAA